MTLHELRAQRKALQEQLRAIVDRAELTDEDVTQAEGLRAQVDEVDRRIDLLGRVREVEERGEQRPAAGPPVGDRERVEVGETLRDRDPNRGYRTPREFLQEVMDAEIRGRTPERLVALRTAGSDEQGVYADTFGGFLVPEGFAPNVLSLAPDVDPIAGLTTNVPMQTAKVSIPARVDKSHSTSVSGGLTVARSAETVSKTASRMELEKLSFEAHSLFGLAYVTEELMTDSPVTFTSLLAAGFRDEFASRLMYERLNGTGVGEYLGVLKAPCLISVTKEAGQAADTIVYDNVLKMAAQCWRYGRAVWLANNTCRPQIQKLSAPIGTGGSLVYQQSIVQDAPDMLLGRPIYYSEYASKLGDVGDLILGVWSEYLEGTYQPLQSAESMHVRFLNHERTFKFWVRNAGAPWWRSALTPKNGDQLSPFVTLAERA